MDPTDGLHETPVLDDEVEALVDEAETVEALELLLPALLPEPEAPIDPVLPDAIDAAEEPVVDRPEVDDESEADIVAELAVVPWLRLDVSAPVVREADPDAAGAVLRPYRLQEAAMPQANHNRVSGDSNRTRGARRSLLGNTRPRSSDNNRRWVRKGQSTPAHWGGETSRDLL